MVVICYHHHFGVQSSCDNINIIAEFIFCSGVEDPTNVVGFITKSNNDGHLVTIGQLYTPAMLRVPTPLICAAVYIWQALITTGQWSLSAVMINWSTSVQFIPDDDHYYITNGSLSWCRWPSLMEWYCICVFTFMKNST